MLMRAVTALSLLGMLMLILYLPAAYPPEQFIQQLRIEHALNSAWWGHDPALRLLSRTLDWHTAATLSSPLPRPFTTPPAAGPQTDAVARPLAHSMARIGASPYVRALDALLVLATYRATVLLEWSPLLLVFAGAAVFDGAMLRSVKRKEFLPYDPEQYALYACAAILTTVATALVCVLPATVHPALLVAAPALIALCARGALAHYYWHG